MSRSFIYYYVETGPKLARICLRRAPFGRLQSVLKLGRRLQIGASGDARVSRSRDARVFRSRDARVGRLYVFLGLKLCFSFSQFLGLFFI
jgi:hypothetical protein